MKKRVMRYVLIGLVVVVVGVGSYIFISNKDRGYYCAGVKGA